MAYSRACNSRSRWRSDVQQSMLTSVDCSGSISVGTVRWRKRIIPFFTCSTLPQSSVQIVSSCRIGRLIRSCFASWGCHKEAQNIWRICFHSKIPSSASDEHQHLELSLKSMLFHSPFAQNLNHVLVLLIHMLTRMQYTQMQKLTS